MSTICAFDVFELHPGPGSCNFTQALGIVLDSKLSWSEHANHICLKASRTLGTLKPHCCYLPHDCRSLFFSLYICPIFDYCDIAWCGLSNTISDKLEVCQRKLLKMLFCLPRDFSSAQLYVLAHVCPLSIRCSLHSNMLIQKIKLEKVPRHLFPYDWFVPSLSTRAQVSLPAARTVQFTKSPLCHS